MKAIVSSPQGAIPADIADPVPGPGEALVRLRAGLVLPGDVRAARTLSHGLALGQAFVGTVEGLGPQALASPAASRPKDAKAWLGKRVAVHPLVRCGRCDRCLGGLSAHCRERTILGVDGRSGGFAERVAVPLSNLLLLPDALDDDRAVFAVPVAAALEATRHVRIEGKTYITVLGDGATTLVTAQVMSRLNAAVRIVARERGTLAAAEKLGVKHRHADEIGRRGDQDVVVDCVGTAESLAFAAQLVRARGTIVLTVATTGAAVPADLSPIVLNELRVQGSSYGPLADAVDLLAKRAAEVISLIERKATLAEASTAFRLAAEPGRLAVVLRGA